MSAVTLRETTDENRQAILALRVEPSQERFVGTVAGALRDVRDIPEGKPWYRVIYADEHPVGFLMLSWNRPRTGRSPSIGASASLQPANWTRTARSSSR